MSVSEKAKRVWSGLQDVEDFIFEAGRLPGLQGFVVQAAVLSAVGSLYIVGALGMQGCRLVQKLWGRKF